MDFLAFMTTVVVTATIAGLATPAFAAFARRRALMVRPRDDRWHRRPTAMLGGGAIAFAALVVLVAYRTSDSRVAVVAVASLAAFALGLLDDIRRLAPTTKLVGQVIVAMILVVGGVRVEIVSLPPLAFVLTIFWVIALMNAINLMDNMDGLAAGIATIAAFSLGWTAITTEPTAALVAAVTAGAAAGFLVHNWWPARVFMGDAGSQLLGLLLAAAALLHTGRAATGLGITILAPLAALALPLFDTTFVAAARRFAGRPVSKGGRDHTSHRLVALGLTDRAAVLVLYGIAAAFAVLGVATGALQSLVPMLFGIAALGLMLFGLFLGEVDVYAADARGAPARNAVRGRLIVYARFGAEVALDVVALTVAYYSAYLLRFEGLPENVWIQLLVASLPLVVGAQLVALVGVGVYRALWRYLAVTDAFLIVRAIAIGTTIAVLGVLLLFRFEGYSRAVFVLDGIFAAALIAGSRLFFVWLRYLFSPRASTGGRRVLIVGATENGAVAARLLRSSGHTYRAVGILDDDPGKQHRHVAGIPILGRADELDRVAGRLQVDLVVLALEDRDEELSQRVRALCSDRGIECREFIIPI